MQNIFLNSVTKVHGVIAPIQACSINFKYLPICWGEPCIQLILRLTIKHPFPASVESKDAGNVVRLHNRVAQLVHALLVVLRTNHPGCQIQSFGRVLRPVLVSLLVLTHAFVEGQRCSTRSLFIGVFVLVFSQLIKECFPRHGIR